MQNFILTEVLYFERDIQDEVIGWGREQRNAY